MQAEKKKLFNDLLSNDPVKFCLEFQNNHQLEPGLQNALNFTSALGIPRGEMLQGLVASYQTQLLQRIAKMDVTERLKLLEASLSKLDDVNLRSIPQLLLESHPVDLPDVYYSTILPQLSQEIQEFIPVKVRRRGWEKFPKLQFEAIVNNLIDAYLNDRLVKATSSTESFDCKVFRRRDKIKSLEMFKSILAESKPLLRACQQQILEKLVSFSNHPLSTHDPALLCALYSDIVMVCGPSDRSTLQDVPYLVELIKTFDTLPSLPVHPQIFPAAGRMHLTKVNATLLSLHREFRMRTMGSGSSLHHGTGSSNGEANGGIAKQKPVSLSLVIQKLLERLKSKNRVVFDFFHMPVIETYPEYKAAYLAVVSHPMDLKTMETKKYTHLDEIMEDCRLIVSNCRAYNPGNTFDDRIEVLLTVTQTILSEFRERVEPPPQEIFVAVEGPQSISQQCMDCFMVIGDPLFARKVAKLEWEVLYGDCFNRGKLPRDVPSLRILSQFLMMAKDSTFVQTMAQAFLTKTEMVVKMPDVQEFLTGPLMRFQTVLLFREQVSLHRMDEVFHDSFLNVHCKASIELYWRYLVEEDDVTCNPPLMKYFFSTNPSSGVLKMLAKKKSKELLMEEYFLKLDPPLEVKVLESASVVFSSYVGEGGNDDVWKDYFRHVMQGVDADMFGSKAFKRARVGFEEFLSREEYQELREEFGFPEQLNVQRSASTALE